MAHLDVTKENYDELIANIGKPVLLDFWAPWCLPCQQLAPVVEQIGEEREDVFVGKVNIEEERELARRYHVMSIPTLMVLKGGQVTGRAVGYRNRDEILNLLEQA